MIALPFGLTLMAFWFTLFPNITNAAYENNNRWSPYLSLDGGHSSQRINNVTFENLRHPELIQNSNYSAVPCGSVALGTRVFSMPLRMELRTTVNRHSNFNREYFFPSFFTVVGLQKLNIRSNYLMLRSYYELPFQVLVPYLSQQHSG